MIKYFKNEKEISKVEFEELLEKDGRVYGCSKRDIKNTIKEMMNEVKEKDMSEWVLFNKDKLFIKNI